MSWKPPFNLPSLDHQSLDEYKSKLSAAADSAKEQASRAYTDAQSIGSELYHDRAASLAESLKEKASKAYGDAQAIGVDGYKERAALLVESAKETASSVYADAQAIDIDEFKERAVVLVETARERSVMVYDGGRAHALNFHRSTVAPTLEALGEGTQKAVDIAMGVMRSVSIMQAVEVACQVAIHFIANIARKHPYIIGWTLLSIGFHPLLDVLSLLSKLVLWVIGFAGRGVRRDSIASRYQSEHSGPNGVSRGSGFSHLQSTGARRIIGPSTIIETLLWPFRLWLGVQGVKILIKALASR